MVSDMLTQISSYTPEASNPLCKLASLYPLRHCTGFGDDACSSCTDHLAPYIRSLHRLSSGFEIWSTGAEGMHGCCTGRDGLEQWLLLGASRWEATQSLIRKATMAALAPTLSHISVMGLVTIPNTMSGQLLGGSAPIQVRTWILHSQCDIVVS